MDKYDVVTNDDNKVGHVVDTQGNFLVVEHGLLRKARTAVPRDMAAIDEQDQTIRLSISKDVFADAPALDGDEVDTVAAAEYYGLASESTEPDTQGYGDITPGDPARTAEQDARMFTDESPEQERARVREAEGAETGFDTQPRVGSVGIHQDRYEVKE
jgi:hypothetical protein